MEDGWQDNNYTVLASIIHERVHSGNALQKSKGKIVLSDVYIYSNKLGIYGKTDALELICNANGININGYPQQYLLQIIEYKPSLPNGEPLISDRIQVFAQVKCLEEIFNINVKAYIYYSDIRKRVDLNFTEKDNEILLNTINQINLYKNSKIIPKIEYSNKCSGCSLLDKCMPNLKNYDVKKDILKNL